MENKTSRRSRRLDRETDFSKGQERRVKRLLGR